MPEFQRTSILIAADGGNEDERPRDEAPARRPLCFFLLPRPALRPLQAQALDDVSANSFQASRLCRER